MTLRQLKDNPLKLILTLISLLIIGYQIYQSFSTSYSLDMVGYRGEDDGVFFPIIAKIHNHLLHFRIDVLIKGHVIGEHFGYGWLFWMVSAIFAIPGAIISHLWGIDNFLIASPYFLSLILSFGGLLIFYKSLSYYTKDELIKFSIIILILSYPAFGYLSIKWHPTSFNFFFNCLLFYHLAKLETVTKKQLCLIAIILAMSIGSRITGLFMLPMTGLFLADRLQWKINKANLKLAGYFCLILLFFSLLFYDPSLLLFKKSYYLENYKIINHWSSLLVNSFGCQQCSDYSLRFTSGVWEPFFEIYIFAFLTLLFVAAIAVSLKRNSNFRRYDLIYMFLTLAIVIVYLTYFVKYYTSYSFIPYFYTVSFLFPISLVILNKQKTIIKIFVLTILLFSNFFLNYKKLYIPYQEYQTFYDCFYKERGKNCNWISQFKYVKYNHHQAYHKDFITSATNMKKIIGSVESYNKGLYLLMDFRVPTFYNPFIYKNVNISSIFENLSLFKEMTHPKK